jgi:hypothetical protein
MKRKINHRWTRKLEKAGKDTNEMKREIQQEETEGTEVFADGHHLRTAKMMKT